MNASQHPCAAPAPASSTSGAASSSSFKASPAALAIVPPAPVSVKTPSTDAFLKDFTLVAEAAKRAQIAVMMRDFENVGL